MSQDPMDAMVDALCKKYPNSVRVIKTSKVDSQKDRLMIGMLVREGKLDKRGNDYVPRVDSLALEE